MAGKGDTGDGGRVKLMWCSNQDGFCFVTVQLEEVELHPCLYLLQAGGQCGQRSSGGGVGPYVKLGVISIAMVGNPMPADELTQGEQVESKEGGTQHRALRDTACNIMGVGPCFAQVFNKCLTLVAEF